MNRKLIVQTLNSWRANLWLALELLIVSVVIWYAVDYCYVSYRVYNEPLGFDISHCYRINISEIRAGSPQYVKRTRDERIADKQKIFDLISHRPEVEYISFSNVSHPYNMSNSGRPFRYDTIWSNSFVQTRYVTKDFFNVFRIKGYDGMTSQQLADKFDNSGVYISSNLFGDNVDALNIINDSIHSERDSYKVLGVINPIKTSEHYPIGNGDKTVILNLSPEIDNALFRMDELCVRVRENMDKDFIHNLMTDAPKYLRVGNYFVGSVDSFRDYRENIISNDRQELISIICGMGFILFNVFLGLFGSFWFRTQQRVGEIAIRKVNGATRYDIFNRLIGEGLLILTVVTPFALIIDAILSYFGLNRSIDDGTQSINLANLFICVALTYILIALMIVAGVFFPATKAMRVDPATILHDE